MGLADVNFVVVSPVAGTWRSGRAGIWRPVAGEKHDNRGYWLITGSGRGGAGGLKV